MTTPSPDAVDPWVFRTSVGDLDDLARVESLLALSNGHIGLRGTLEEGEPRAVPGTYVNGFYEERPLPHPEAGYGFPESGQTVINVTDGKLIRLLVGDSPFDTRYGTLRSHERSLDLRSGVLDRCTDWTSPNGTSIRIRSKRLVSFAHRTLAAIRYEVEALDDDVHMALQSDLLANEPTQARVGDPRATALLERPLVAELAAHRAERAVLVHRAVRSGLRVAAGMDHLIELPKSSETSLEAEEDLARYTVACRLAHGQRLRLVKLIAYDWSSRRSAPALRDQVDAALTLGRLLGWDELASLQRSYLDEYWRTADVELDGDPELEQAVRLSTFHVLQAGARSDSQGIPAKGLTGPGYDGHSFWDTEVFVLPVLTYTAPDAVRSALRWRHRTLPSAQARAAVLGLEGASFPWRTINGEECSGYWPAGTAAFHVNGAVAVATARYLAAVEDEEFETSCGVELLVETARLWASLGNFALDGSFRIDGVTGPDEYSAVVDDNIYTNLIAQQNFRDAADACRRRPDLAELQGVTEPEIALWCRAADAVTCPFDEKLGVHSQDEGFTDHAEWDFEATPPEQYPLLLHHPYFQLYRKQVVKQADLVLAMHVRGDAFSAAEKARGFAYYEARTVRDSSLSASTQAVMAAEVGHLDLAYDYWTESAFADLQDLYGNVDDGVHLGAMAGTWMVAVAGFGGMRDQGGRITFAPRLPPALSCLRFRMRFAGRSLLVAVHPDEAIYTLLDGDPLVTSHHGERIELAVDEPVVRPVPPPPTVAPVSQPPGRAPQRRTGGTADQS